jgi:hypothetical protein
VKTSRIGVLLLVLGMVFTTGCLGIFSKDYTISGVVVDTEDNTLEGIEIVISGGTSTTVKTDAEGKWTAKVKGKVTVTPKHEDYAFEPEELEVEKAASDLNFVGTRLSEYAVSGVILDDEGQPLPGAVVKITGQVEREVTADEEGKWAVADVKGKTNITAEAEFYKFGTETVTGPRDDVQLKGDYILVARYEFAEVDEDKIADSSKNQNDAELIGSFTSIEGPVDGAIKLNGIDNYVQMPEGIIADLEELTVSTWVRLDEKRYWSRVFSFGNNSDDPDDGVLFLAALGSNFETDEHQGWLKLDWAVYGIEDSDIFVLGPILEVGRWYHVAVTLTKDTASLYVDGELYDSTDNIALPKDLGVTEQNYIGKSNNRWPDPLLNGAIADFRIYSAALSAEQIAALAAK